jgi:hypothetical protein
MESSVLTVYWSWNGGPREGRGIEALEKGGQISGGGGAGGGWDSIYENDQSAKVNNLELAMDLFKTSTEITGANWPDVSVVRSPCPTLNVIGAISKAMIEKEELKRMEQRPGFDAEGKPVTLPKTKKVKVVTQKVVGGVFRRTVGRVGRFLSRRLLGRIPDTALQGSFQEERPAENNPLLATTGSTTTPTAVMTKDVTSEKGVNEVDAFMIHDADLVEQEISEQIFSEYHNNSMEKEGMKSDQELIEELMTNKKKEQQSSV